MLDCDKTPLSERKMEFEAMVSGFARQDAKIYIFPVRDRIEANRRKETARSAAAANAWVYEVAGSGAWYHEAAIKDEDRGRKN